MPQIAHITAREILDSRDDPTIEVDVALVGGATGRAAVPAGASAGSYEAVDLRDNDPHRYGGRGVLQAVDNVNRELRAALESRDFDQIALDETMIGLDGTTNKSRLGGNAILGVSLAFARAAARHEGLPLYRYFAKLTGQHHPHRLPLPLFNIFNGGRHAPDTIDFQEFMVVPVGAPNFHEALRWGVEVLDALKLVMAAKKIDTDLGDEGGLTAKLSSNEQALELIMAAIKKAGYEPGRDLAIAIDVAASEFYQPAIKTKTAGKYFLKTENQMITADELIALYQNWAKRYPLISIEDGLAEDDWVGWQKLTNQLGQHLQIVGDDLFATNLERLEHGLATGAANTIIIKLNQIGTVSEALAVALHAQRAGFRIIVSHRSGETEDSIIADLAVGLGAEEIKAGAPNRGERTSKYNELLRIEEELGNKAVYFGHLKLKS